LCVVKASYW